MKCVEVITLRSLAKDNRKKVDELLRQVLRERKEPGFPASIRVYRHPMVETDLSIHIQWELEGQYPGKSPLGELLSYTLKGVGLLNHTLWVELEEIL